jgi:hypothetical protein
MGERDQHVERHATSRPDRYTILASNSGMADGTVEAPTYLRRGRGKGIYVNHLPHPPLSPPQVTTCQYATRGCRTHGTGILQKIFDLTDTIADILMHVPAAINETKTNLSHLGDFVFLYRFLLSMSKFYHVEETILRTKLETLQPGSDHRQTVYEGS